MPSEPPALASPGSPPLKVLVACSGLGRVRRGYESFADECFDALRRSDRVTAQLLHGPGEVTRPGEFAAPLVSHRAFLAEAYARLRARGYRPRRDYEAAGVEQASFGLAVARHAARHGTDVILFSELQLGAVLGRLRRWFGLRYRTLFSNGGPHLPPFPGCDHIQQLTPSHLTNACGRGVPDAVQSMVPYGFAMPAGVPSDKAAHRRTLNLPIDRPIVLSVAAIKRTHKRLDYLIDEVAALGGERPYVLFLGQTEDESDAVKAQAASMLGEGNHRFASVSNTGIGPYYQASDLFVLSSLSEGLPRVLVEAMAHGLPCLVHDYAITRFVLGEWGFYADFSKPGGLTYLLRGALENVHDLGNLAGQRQASVRGRFGWDHLLPAYERMLFTAAGKRLS